MRFPIFIILLVIVTGCIPGPEKERSRQSENTYATPLTHVSLVILGNVQDGGSPHIACRKSCCRELFDQPDANRQVVSVGLIDPYHNKKFLFEATPDLPRQMKKLKTWLPANDTETPNAIFLTHAHIGHYAGLMYLGKEAMNASEVPVYAMPRMKHFLEDNGPWSQLVGLKNIRVKEIFSEQFIEISRDLRVMPVTVPHRDEFSETVGYIISGPEKSALFIPDIDKWDKWDRQIITEISKVDYAFLDGTFYDGEEINTRNISEIPHPFIVESMELFKDLPPAEKDKIYFIHFNHTNPVLDPFSQQSEKIEEMGFHIARFGEVFAL